MSAAKPAQVIKLPVERVEGAWHRRIFRALRVFLLSRLVIIILWILRVTLRWREPVYAASLKEALSGPFIMTFWHSRLVLPCWWYKSIRKGTTRNLNVIISAHGDGRIIAAAMEALGFEITTGSSSRGGARALAQMIRVARDGGDLCVTPDGPRGPAEVVKRGVIDLAMHTGLPIVPLSFRVSSCWRIRSWDRLIIPKPFAVAQFWVGRPMVVSKSASLGEREELARELAETLIELGGE